MQITFVNNYKNLIFDSKRVKVEPMERTGGWRAFETRVRVARTEIAAREAYDPVKLEEEARAKFEVARAQMYKIGAIDLMRAVAPLLPRTTLSIIDDYEQAGGRGFAPMVILKGLEKSLDISEEPSFFPKKIVVASEFNTLNVYPLNFNSLRVSVVIQTHRLAKIQGGHIIPSSYRKWDSIASGGEHQPDAYWKE